MAKKINTEILINATPARVWSILTDFEQYPAWNPFIPSITGELITGSKLLVNIRPPGKKYMRLTPTVLTCDVNKELSWLGHVFFKGILDGEHKFNLLDQGNGTTIFSQSEIFSGVLLPIFWKQFKDSTIKGFEEMNTRLKELSEQQPKGI